MIMMLLLSDDVCVVMFVCVCVVVFGWIDLILIVC